MFRNCGFCKGRKIVSQRIEQDKTLAFVRPALQWPTPALRAGEQILVRRLHHARAEVMTKGCFHKSKARKFRRTICICITTNYELPQSVAVLQNNLHDTKQKKLDLLGPQLLKEER